MQLLEVAGGSSATSCAARLYGMGGNGTSREFEVKTDTRVVETTKALQDAARLGGLLLAKEVAGTPQYLDARAVFATCLGEVAPPAPCTRLAGEEAQDMARHSAE